MIWGDRMTETARSSFWDDLNRRMESPKFRRNYIDTSLRIQVVDNLVNAIDERRLALNMSKEDLAKVTGQKGSVVRRIFSRRHVNPTLETYVIMAYAVGLELKLVEHEEEETEEAKSKASNTCPPRPLHAS